MGEQVALEGELEFVVGRGMGSRGAYTRVGPVLHVRTRPMAGLETRWFMGRGVLVKACVVLPSSLTDQDRAGVCAPEFGSRLRSTRASCF